MLLQLVVGAFKVQKFSFVMGLVDWNITKTSFQKLDKKVGLMGIT
jgi:hypothetical protein